MSQLLALPLYRLTDSNGIIIPNGRLYSFLTTTLTPAATYTTSALNVSHGSYVQANSAGLLPPIYLDPAVSYRFQVRATPYAAAVTGMDFDPVTAASATDTTFLPSGSGAVQTTVDTYLNRAPIYVETFRASGYTDLQTWQAAIAALIAKGGGLLIADKGRTYSFGTFSAESSVLTLTGLRNCVIDGNGSKITLTTATHLVNVLYFTNFENVTICNLRCVDLSVLGYASGAQGARFFVLDTDASVACNGFTIRDCAAETMNTYLAAQGTVTNRINRIRLEGHCYLNNGLYGFNFQNNGDDVSGRFTAFNVGRVYFPYGVTAHNLDLRINNDGGGPTVTACVLIKRYTRNTTNIRVAMSFSGTFVDYTTLVSVEHANADGAASIIDDIHLDYHVEQGITDSGPAIRLRMKSWLADDATENVGSISHYTKFISITGQLGTSTVAHVQSSYTATTTGVIDMSGAISGYSLVKTVSAPGMLVKTGPDNYVLEKYGDLTSGVISIPLAALAAKVALFEIDIAAERSSVAATASDATKMHRYCDTVGIVVEDGIANIIVGSPIAAIPATAFNTSNLTRAYTGNGLALEITLAGSDYAVSTAFARVNIKALTRQLIR